MPHKDEQTTSKQKRRILYLWKANLYPPSNLAATNTYRWDINGLLCPLWPFNYSDLCTEQACSNCISISAGLLNVPVKREFWSSTQIGEHTLLFAYTKWCTVWVCVCGGGGVSLVWLCVVAVNHERFISSVTTSQTLWRAIMLYQQINDLAITGHNWLWNKEYNILSVSLRLLNTRFISWLLVLPGNSACPLFAPSSYSPLPLLDAGSISPGKASAPFPSLYL